MIKLTGTSGTVVYINPDKIIAFNEDDGKTFIEYGNDRYIVTEPAAEVARKVLEYRLAVERYKAAYAEEVVRYENRSFITDEVNYAKRELKELAGLEDQA